MLSLSGHPLIFRGAFVAQFREPLLLEASFPPNPLKLLFNERDVSLLAKWPACIGAALEQARV